MSKKDPLLPWNDFSEGLVVQYEKNMWVVRTGIVVNRPKRTKKFEDKKVVLHQISGESNSVLGYVFRAKRDFDHVFERETFISLLSVTKHKNPEYLYKDPKVHLLRYGTSRSPSYQFLVRHRP